MAKKASMRTGPLKALLSDKFTFPFAALATANAIRTHLRSTDELKSLRGKLREGVIDGAEIRTFTTELLSKHKSGQMLPGEPALCALAVLLEEDASAVASEFLQSLANSKAGEISMARRVASLVLKQRE